MQLKILFCDNRATLYISPNSVFHERTKHIKVDFHFILDALLDGTIYPTFVPTIKQLANIFTKALGKHEYDMFLCKLGIFISMRQLRGY